MPWRLNDMESRDPGTTLQLPVALDSLTAATRAELVASMREYPFPRPVRVETLGLIQLKILTPEEAEASKNDPMVIQAR